MNMFTDALQCETLKKCVLVLSAGGHFVLYCAMRVYMQSGNELNYSESKYMINLAHGD